MASTQSNRLLGEGLRVYQHIASLLVMDTDTPLIADTRARLEARRGDWPQVARDAGVSYSWLCKFAVGTIANPGANHLHALRGVLLRAVAAPDEAAA